MFLSVKSPVFRRDFFIDNILKEQVSHNNFTEYLDKNSPISLEEVFGSTFQSSYRHNDQIYQIQFDILSIGKDELGFYGIIKMADYSPIRISNTKKSLPNLRPVYYKYSDDKNDYLIATFDMDLNIMPED